MATLHITEAELARDLHALLEKVRQGTEIIVEQDHRVVAVMRPPSSCGRTITESIRIAQQRERERGHAATLDPDFADSVEEIVANRKPWTPPAWD